MFENERVDWTVVRWAGSNVFQTHQSNPFVVKGI